MVKNKTEIVMALTQSDKELIKLIVVEACREILSETIPQVISAHVDSCPHAKVNNKRWYLSLGVVAGVSLISGGAGFGIAKILIGV